MFWLIGRRLLLVCFLVKRKCGSHRTTNNANKHENSKKNRLDVEILKERFCYYYQKKFESVEFTVNMIH